MASGVRALLVVALDDLVADRDAGVAVDAERRDAERGSDFGFFDNRGKFVVEPGAIDVYAGNSSSADLKESFTVGG